MLQNRGRGASNVSNVGAFSHAKEIEKYLNFVLKHGVLGNVNYCFIFGRCCKAICDLNPINRLPNITEISPSVLAPVQRVVSPTFRELYKTFSRNLYIAEIALLMIISAEILNVCPKHAKFRLAILTINVITGIVNVHEIILESSRNVSETIPWSLVTVDGQFQWLLKRPL